MLHQKGDQVSCMVQSEGVLVCQKIERVQSIVLARKFRYGEVFLHDRFL